MRNGVLTLFFLLGSLNYFPSEKVLAQNDFLSYETESLLFVSVIENIDISISAIEQECEHKQMKGPILSFLHIPNRKIYLTNFFDDIFIITQYYHHLLNNQIDLPPPFIS